jgi:autotransporter-associated beta strand protein
MYTRGRIRSISMALSVLCSIGVFSGAAEAETRQWVGASGGLWSVDSNWSPLGAPANGDTVVFPVGAPASSVNDVVAPGFLVLNSVRFEGSHTVQGVRFDVTGGIDVQEDATLQNPLHLLTGAAIGGDATLTLNGEVTAPGDNEITGVTVNAMNNQNSFTGTLTVGAGGTFIVGVQGAFGMSPTPTSGVHLAGGTLNVNSSVMTVRRLTGNGTLDFGNDPIFRAGFILDNATANEFTGTIVGFGYMGKNGPGTLTLGGPTTFDGWMTLGEGELVIAHGQALASQDTQVIGGATLTYDVPSTRTSLLSVGGTGLNGVGALRLRGGTLTQTGETRIIAQETTIAVAAPHQLLLQGPLTGPTDVTVIGDGTVLISQMGNLPLYSLVIGNGTVPGPTLLVGAQYALGLVPTTVTAGGTLDLNGHHVQIASLSGSGRLVTSNGGVAQFMGNSNFTGTFHGPGNVILMATSQPVTFAGTHTLSGTVDTQSPHLTVTGTIPALVRSAGDKVTLAPGSTTGGFLYAPLSTTGQLIAGDSTNPGGTITGALDILGGVFKPMLSGTAPRITANGTVTINIAATLDLNYVGVIPPGELTLIANDGTDPITGVFANQIDGSQVTFNDVIYVLNYRGGDGNDLTLSPPITSYHLSEGATGAFFDTDLLIANPWDQQIIVDVTFLPENAAPLTQQYTLMPKSRRTISVDQISGLESAAFSTIAQPNVERTIAVERTMRWDASGYGGHTEKATAGPATTWYFAEGSEGFFRTFLLLANPQTTPNVAHVTWLREGAGAIERSYDLLPTSRKTIAAVDDSELVNQAFGMTVRFDQPGVAERAMYFGGPPAFKGGHESAGVTAPSTTWLLAEGATGDGFDTFILIANPGAEEAEVTFTFLPADGAPATLKRKVAGHSRITVNPEGESLPIPLGPVGTQVDSTQPVIAERAQYWPLGPVQWTEAHNSFGVTEAAPRWVLAEGRVGGSEGYQTYILLANPGSVTANVELVFLGDGQQTAPATKTVQVPPQQRVNVTVETGTPNVTTFGTSITSDQPIVVERAMYWNVGGEVWAAGTNATATRMVP